MCKPVFRFGALKSFHSPFSLHLFIHSCRGALLRSLCGNNNNINIANRLEGAVHADSLLPNWYPFTLK
jgi:hypothetical protein